MYRDKDPAQPPCRQALTMVRLTCCILSVLLLCSNVLAFGKRRATKLNPYENSRLERYLSRVYADADTNHDGKLNLDECYELVLRLYVQINQQAPIPPPSREKVKRFLQEADTSHNNSLSREEFSALAKLLYGRAAVRLTAYKVVTLAVAPLTATYLAHVLGQNKALVRTLQDFVRRVVPFEKLAENLCSPAFGRTLLIIIFMATLGDFVLTLVNASLDMYHLPDRKEKRFGRRG